jgi:hypothetical protein
MLHDARAVEDAARRHVQRIEDAGLHELPVRLSGRLLDDHAEQEVTGVRVERALARRERQRLVCDEVEDLARRHAQQRRSADLHDPVGADAAGVREQLAHRHRRPRPRRAVDVRGDRGVEPDFPVLHEQHDRGGGELLRDGRQLEHRVGIERRFGLEVGEAVRFREHDPTAVDHGDRGPGDSAVAHVAGDDGVDRRELGAIERLGWKGGSVEDRNEGEHAGGGARHAPFDGASFGRVARGRGSGAKAPAL